MLLEGLRALLHERPDHGRRRVVDRDPVALDQVPVPVGAGVARRPLELDGRRAVGERTVDEVRVPRDPADVGLAPVDVVVLDVEDPLRRGLDLREVAAGGVHDALGLARRARGVEDVEDVLGVHLLGRALVVGLVHQVVPVLVAALRHVHVLAERCATTTLCMEGVSSRASSAFALRGVTLPPRGPAVGGDEHLGLAVVDAVAQRVGGEGAEDDRVRGPDAGAGQHRDGQLGDHGQVDRDRVALLHPEALEHVGELLDLGLELGVGEGLAVARLVALPEYGGLVTPALLDLVVEAVVGDVRLAADEPLGLGRVPVEDLVPLLEPVQLPGPLGPEALVVLLGLLVDRGIVHVGLRGELLGRLVGADLCVFCHRYSFPLRDARLRGIPAS